ncbi:hypothetical protein H4R34_003836 [Dimargaris verticillata]|uniref:Periplasmic binding protein n=1 Tax=Dimargaris verticillata TaxID=2761393 RepID=A0A9W8B1K3_9FUNG|nr:hypothetical protein H4R34_003836 [Dimargaris verticillata]
MYPTAGKLALASLALLAWSGMAHADDICNGDPDKDNFPNKVVVSEAANFTVTYSNNYKLVTNEVSGETYGLYCGSSPPNQGGDVKNWYQVPLRSVAVMDRSVLPFLEILKQTSSIKIVDNHKNVTSPCIQTLLQKNEIKPQQQSGQDDWEGIQLAFTAAADNRTSYVTFSAGDDRIPPVQRAEWIKYVSLFYNAEETAMAFYEHVAAQYDCHKNNAAKAKGRNIAWTRHSSPLGRDPELWSFQTTAYVDGLTDNAGAHLTRSNDLDSTSTDTFHKGLKSVDYIIDQTNFGDDTVTFDQWKDLFGYSSDPGRDGNVFYYKKQVWRTNKRRNPLGYSDWAETPLARPDLVLADLVSLQYPSYQDDYDLLWFESTARNATPTTVGPGSCDDDALVFKFPSCPSGMDTSRERFNTDSNGDDSDDDSDDDDDDDDDGLGVGRIVGIVVGSLAAVAVLAVLYVYAARQRRRQRLQEFINLRNRNSQEFDERETL